MVFIVIISKKRNLLLVVLVLMMSVMLVGCEVPFIGEEATDLDQPVVSDYTLDDQPSGPKLILDLPEDVTVDTDIFKVSGVTELNAQLFINDLEVPVTAEETFTGEVTLQAGENNIRVQALDQNNLSTTVELKINFDPAVIVDDPETVAEVHVPLGPSLILNLPVKNRANEDMITNFDKLKVPGVTVAGSQLFINGETVRVKRDGTFSHEVTLQAGKNIVQAVAVDASGNSTVVERRITFSSCIPSLQLFAPPESTTVTVDISGLTAPNAMVYLDNNKIEAEESGSFTGTVELRTQGENKFIVVAVNEHGVSTTQNMVIKGIPPRVEVTAPDITTNNEATIVGVTDTNSTIVMLVSGNKVEVNNNDGTFDIPVSLEPGFNDFVLLATNFFGTTEVPVPVLYDDFGK